MDLKNTKIAGMALALMMLIGALVVPASAEAAPADLTEQLTTEDGSTDLLGGGDHFFVRFGEDSAFGIVWGTEENPNNVYFVSIVARYLGVAQFYNNQGELLRANHSCKVYTMYAVKLDNVLEFNDLNQNGVLGYMRTYNEEANAYSDYISIEPIYKMASLKTAWNASEIIFTEDEDGKHWDFDLTASEIPYRAIRENADVDVGDGVLNEFKLSFHLDASAMHVDNASIPQWRVTVNHGPLGATWFTGLQRMENREVSGDVPRYQVKWDKEIVGWDFDANNTNPMLLVEFETILGNYIPPFVNAVLNELQYRLMLLATNQLGYMEMQSETGQVMLNQSTGGLPSAKEVASPRLSFGGEWSKVGRLEWVTNITVDGEPQQARAQVMAAYAFMIAAHNGMTFAGFASLCGITYAAGAAIVHDPTYSAESMVNVSYVLDDGDQAPFPFWLLMMAGVVVGAVLISALILARRQGSGSRSKDSYERPASEEKSEWSEYYEKK
ncbi:MAG: hypothetical protein MUE65_06740 [Methanomassiliicoccales archaeon]|nr:hypothetical protein [Methanomassiliicoccales archaeon]